MIRLTELLNERKQVGDVYHFTSASRLYRILDANLLKSRWSTQYFSRGTLTGFTRSVSTTRDKYFAKTRAGLKSQIGGQDFALVLDGTKMSDRHRTMSYNDAYNPKDTEEENRESQAAFGDEMEQIWYGPEIEGDGIKNIKQYIKKIIITKKFQRDIANYDYDDTMFDKEFVQQFKKTWTYETTPQDKLQQLQEFIENKYNIPVEIEK